MAITGRLQIQGSQDDEVTDVKNDDKESTMTCSCASKELESVVGRYIRQSDNCCPDLTTDRQFNQNTDHDKVPIPTHTPLKMKMHAVAIRCEY